MDFALKKDDNYYLQVFLKEPKHVVKDFVRHVHDNLSECSSSDDDFDEK